MHYANSILYKLNYIHKICAYVLVWVKEPSHHILNYYKTLKKKVYMDVQKLFYVLIIVLLMSHDSLIVS